MVSRPWLVGTIPRPSGRNIVRSTPCWAVIWLPLTVTPTPLTVVWNDVVGWGVGVPVGPGSDEGTAAGTTVNLKV